MCLPLELKDHPVSMIVDLRLLLVVVERMGAPPASADLLRETGSMWCIVRRKSPLVAFFFNGL